LARGAFRVAAVLLIVVLPISIGVLLAVARQTQLEGRSGMRIPPQASRVSPDEFEVVSLRPSGTGGAGGRGETGSGVSVLNGCAATQSQLDPRRFAANGVTVYTLLTWAYSGNFSPLGGCFDLAPLNLITGGPDWIKFELWDLEAVLPRGVSTYTFDVANWMRRSDKAPELQKMIANLLRDRFKLSFRRETKEVPGYALVMQGAKPKFTPPAIFNEPSFKSGWDARPSGETRAEPGGFTGKDVPIAALVPMLARETGRPVLNRTGFKDPFSFFLAFTPLNSTNRRLTGPPLLKALEEQVGLRLEDTKSSVEIWVIERVEKPSDN
jgi:uncharacterized protein (TIGR03435 family)